MKAINGILFDKDGTLMSFDCFWRGVIRAAAERTAQRVAEQYPETDAAPLAEALTRIAGYEPSGACIPESLVVRGTNDEIASAWINALSQRFPALPQNLYDTAYRALSDNRSAGEIRASVPDLPSLLARLAGMGLHLGAATSDSGEQARYCFAEMGALPYFDFIMAGDGAYPPKPAPDGFFAAARQWRTAPNRILMVGDSENDMRFARNAGAPGVLLVPAGKPVPETSAAAVIRTLDALPALIAGINRRCALSLWEPQYSL